MRQQSNAYLLLSLLLTQVARPLRAVSDPLLALEKRLKRGKMTIRQAIDQGLPVVVAGGVDISIFPLGRHIYEEQYLDPFASAASTATNGGSIDLQAAPYREFDAFRFLLLVGATDGTVDMKIQESATGAFGGEETTLKDAAGADVAITQVSATGDNKFSAIELPTRAFAIKRYIRAVVTTGAGAVADQLAVFLQAYGYEGELPTPASADRAELKVPVAAA